MSETVRFILYLVTMAGVTYLLRLLPLLLLNKKFENEFILKFLYYIPYTVLAAMTVPAIFYATSSPVSAAAGAFAALLLAYFRRSLITVALGASTAVFIAEFVLSFIN